MHLNKQNQDVFCQLLQQIITPHERDEPQVSHKVPQAGELM